MFRPDQLRQGHETEPPSSDALAQAIQEQNVGKVAYLLALGADPNATVELESHDIVPLLWFTYHASIANQRLTMETTSVDLIVLLSLKYITLKEIYHEQ